jgi:hypothetical protein
MHALQDNPTQKARLRAFCYVLKMPATEYRGVGTPALTHGWYAALL